jgi:hypothetical protein
MAMTDNTRKVWEFLKANGDADMTAAEVAAALGMEKRQIDGIFTSGLQRKQLGVRVEAERENEKGTHDKVKFLKLTDAGLAFDPDAEE